MIEIADLELVALVTRDELVFDDEPLDPLDLNDGEKFIFGRGFEAGGVVWRREAATSPYVHGRIPVHEVKETSEARVGVYVLGETHEQMQANLAELLQAFTEQYTYQLQISVEGQEHHWRCERADYEVGFVTEFLVARVLPVALSFSRHPIPVMGAF